MRCAVGRATALLEQKGQKIGVLRFANLDVKQLVGVTSMDVYSVSALSTIQTSTTSGGWGMAHKAPAAPPPPPPPEKITVSATVQCAFQIL